MGRHEDPLVGRTIDGRYRVERVLGSGGMGTVYMAVQVAMKRQVALKVVRAEILGEPAHRMDMIRRFQREASTSSLLEHHNTVRVFDSGLTEDGILFLAMEFLRGRTLSKVMQQGPLPAHRVARIAVQVCRSLAEAHEKGVIHRDLKPDNIMLTDTAGESDFVKVLDFGIAKVLGSGKESCLTGTGMIVGTPAYMAPEQGCGGEVGPATDLYSLGVIMYEALSGRHPFTGETPLAVMVKHITAEIPPLVVDGLPYGVPQALSDVVARLLAKEPSRRVRSALELASILERMEIPQPGPRVIADTNGSDLGQVAPTEGYLQAGTTWIRTPTSMPEASRPSAVTGAAQGSSRVGGRGHWRWLAAIGMFAVGLAAAGGVWVASTMRSQADTAASETPKAESLSTAEVGAQNANSPHPPAEEPAHPPQGLAPSVSQGVPPEVADPAPRDTEAPTSSGIAAASVPQPSEALARDQGNAASAAAKEAPVAALPLAGPKPAPESPALSGDVPASPVPHVPDIAPAATAPTPVPLAAAPEQAQKTEPPASTKEAPSRPAKRPKNGGKKVPPCVRSKCPIGAECIDGQGRRIDGRTFCSDLAI